MRLPKSVLFFVFSSALAIPAYAQRGGGGGHARSFHVGASGGFHGGTVSGFHVGTFGGFHGGRLGYYGGLYYGPNVHFGFGWGYPYYGYYPYYYGYPYYAGAYPYYGYYPYYYRYPYQYGYPYRYGRYPASYAPPVAVPQNNGNRNPPQNQPVTQDPPPMQPHQPQVKPQPFNTTDQNLHLIAFKNSLIEAASEYRVEGDQIHWVTRGGQQKQASLSTVDVRFSTQVNRDRGVDFKLP